MVLLRVFALVCIIGFFLWLAGLSLFAVTTLTYPIDTAQIYPAAIVLTGGKDRVKTGLGLLSAGRVKTLFISGVHKDTTLNDIRANADDLDKLPNCCITLGYRATTTLENASETQKWLEEEKLDSVLLITSAYHMPRALMEFKAYKADTILITPLIVPYGADDFNALQTWILLMTEYHKTLYRWMHIHLLGV